MASSLRRIIAKRKIVSCTHCGEWVEVAARAMSIACPKCRKRVVLENIRIQSYHVARKLHTCGNIVIEKRGTLSTNAKAANMTVRGKVWGEVLVNDKVEVTKTGHMRGDVRASRLVVEEGATLNGNYEIGVQKLMPPTGEAAAKVSRM